MGSTCGYGAHYSNWLGRLHSERLSANPPVTRHDPAEAFETVLGLIAQAPQSDYRFAPEARAAFVRGGRGSQSEPFLTGSPYLILHHRFRAEALVRSDTSGL
ncbi:hypothetical protein ACU4GR_13270 [Methylobacterium oryzae CBMB20]